MEGFALSHEKRPTGQQRPRGGPAMSYGSGGSQHSKDQLWPHQFPCAMPQSFQHPCEVGFTNVFHR